ncbi:MAG: Uma2 family endonuclease [Chloroflexi bacterium]|nr:MAG: Uma2 family endonuclease [Chloroflexota bacterium]
MVVQAKPAVTQIDVDELNIRRLSLEEYHRLIEVGFFAEDERVELIEGVLHRMSPKGARHSESLRRLLRMLIKALGGAVVGGEVEISVQDPITIPVGGSEPEPDLTLIVPREGGYTDRHPLPEEVLLLVEIADTSLEEDRDVKLRVYAAAGIKECWIINLVDDQVEVYREPATLADGTATYRQRTLYVAGDTIAPLHFPDCRIEVTPLLP